MLQPTKNKLHTKKLLLTNPHFQHAVTIHPRTTTARVKMAMKRPNVNNYDSTTLNEILDEFCITQVHTPVPTTVPARRRRELMNMKRMQVRGIQQNRYQHIK